MTAYEVRDKPSAHKADDWVRVVAVFVLGKEWQFKDWPFKDHVEIFNKIIGFFMRFEDDSVESAKIVKQWNVKIIPVCQWKPFRNRLQAMLCAEASWKDGKHALLNMWMSWSPVGFILFKLTSSGCS